MILAASPETTALPRRNTTRTDCVLLVVGTVVLRLPAYFADTHMTFDDGVYGASAVAMRHGGKPFAEVFSSQGPLYLPLIWLGDLLGFRTMSSSRLLAVVAGCVLVVAVYLMGRIVTDRFGALLAAGLVTSTASVLISTGPMAADGPALAAGAVTVLLALRWRTQPSTAHAVLIGVAAAVALSIKALLLPAVVPAAIVLLLWRRPPLVVLAGGSAVAFNLLVSLPWGLADVWDQSYAYHLEVAGDRTPVANFFKTVATMGDRDSLVLVLAAAAIVWTLVSRPRLQSTLEERLLLAWVGTTLGVLLLEHPLWRPHVAHLVPAVALLAARRRPPWRIVGFIVLVVVPYHLVHSWFLLSPDPYDAETAAVVEAIRDLPEGAFAVSDEAGLVWRAGRRTTDDLVDGSVLRIETERITSESLAEAAASPEVCAVAVRSRARFGSFEDLPARLAELGYEVTLDDGRGRVLYVKRDCEPSEASS